MKNFDFSSFNVNPEQEPTISLISRIAPFPYRNMADLEKGYAFIFRSNFDKEMANDNTEIYIQASLEPHTSDRSKKYVKYKQLYDQIFIFEKYEEYEYEYCTYTTLFFNSQDQVFCYDYIGTLDDFRDSRWIIQGLVPLDELVFAKETLVGKEVPISISLWMKMTKYGIEEHESWNGNIEQVTITKVGYGENENTPIRLVFKAKDHKEYFVDVCISSTNSMNYVEDVDDRPTGFIDDVLNVKTSEKKFQETPVYNIQNTSDKNKVEVIFLEIKKMLYSFVPKIVESLNFPVAEDTIQKLQKLTTQTLPESFCSVYRVHNGIDNESKNSSNFFYGLTWFSLEETINWYEERIKSYDKTITIAIENADKEIYAQDAQTLAWIPIAWDCSSCFLFLDLNPTDKGTYGQVIFYDSEFSRAICVASSMEALLQQFAQDISNGLYSINEEAKEEDGDEFLETNESIDLINWDGNTRWK